MEFNIVSSRQFNQDVTSAKRVAEKGPVFITDRGRPAHVLLTIEQYRQLTSSSNDKNIIELLAMPKADATEFEPQQLKNGFSQAADLS